MTRIIRPETLNLEKSWNLIPNKLNIKGWNWKKKTIIQKNFKKWKFKEWGSKSLLLLLLISNIIIIIVVVVVVIITTIAIVITITTIAIIVVAGGGGATAAIITKIVVLYKSIQDRITFY